MSALELAGTLSNFSSGNDLEIVDVSAKLSLHPRVWNAIFFLSLVMIFSPGTVLSAILSMAPEDILDFGYFNLFKKTFLN